MSKSHNKIDLKNYFEENFNKIKEFQFLKEFYNHNISKIIKKDSETLDKLGDKLLQIIVVFEGDYKIPEKNFEFILEIIQALIENTKIKIGYIILLNPILEYFINILNIEKEANSDNKNDNSIQNKIIPQNFSYNKINQKKNEYKRINMNFSSYQENNKEKDEQKMKKIFNEIKDVIQEDEKVIIKNRFVNYGYSKDIIFAEDKKNLINKTKINMNKDRPKSRIIKNE